MLEWLAKYWLEVLFSGVLAGGGYLIRRLWKKQQAEEAHPVASGKGEIVRHVVLWPGEARGQLVVEFGVGALGNVAQRDVQGAVVGRIPVHSDTI